MKYVISKGKTVFCTTTIPYNKKTICSMQKAGYKIKEEGGDLKACTKITKKRKQK